MTMFPPMEQAKDSYKLKTIRCGRMETTMTGSTIRVHGREHDTIETLLKEAAKVVSVAPLAP